MKQSRRVSELLDLPRLRAMSPVRAARTLLVCAPIVLYRVVISPLLPRVCRFHPSCSVYALGAVQVHGPVRGGWLALRRITRCHPFHPGGYDPVPPVDSTSPEPKACDSAPASNSGRGPSDALPHP